MGVFSFFYEATLWCLSLFFLPKMLYQRIKRGKYRNSFAKRWGSGFPNIIKGEGKCVWIHAVSVGEMKAIAPLAKELLTLNPSLCLVTSSVTEMGYLEAKRSLPFAKYHVFLPFDFKWIVRRVVKKARPDLVLICETDFWFNFMLESKRLGAKIALVNGKLSEKAVQRFLRVPFFSSRLFSLIDLFCLQGKTYFNRFKSLKIPQEKMIITGNIKLNGIAKSLDPEEKNKLKKRLGIEDHLVLIAGSTHEGEEAAILKAALLLWPKVPQLKIILVPRHLERLSQIKVLLNQLKIAFSCLSDQKLVLKDPVILVDAMGLLKTYYQLADVAFVGGTFNDKVGGHNILEPCEYGIPVVFGPHLFKQPDFLSLVKEYDAGIQVDESHLVDVLDRLFSSRELRLQIGERGKKLIEEMSGATEKTLNSLLKEGFF